MKRIDRYILAAVLKAVLLTLVAIAALSFVLTLMDELGDVGRGDYRVIDALLVVGSRLPRFLYEAFPMSALIGVLLALGGMAAHGELVAMRAAGLSVLQLMGAVVKAGALLMVLVVVVGDLVGPHLEQWGRELRLARLNKQATFHSPYGFWVKDGPAIVNIRRATPRGELQDVNIYHLGEDRRLTAYTHARRGGYQAGHWRLWKVRRSRLDENRVETRFLPELDWETLVDPAMLNVALIRPTLVPAWELYQQMKALEAGGQSGAGYAIAFWNKVATPLVTLAMLLLAVPLVTGGPRQVHAGQWILAGAVVGAGLYLASKGFAYAVMVFSLPPVSVALFPLALLGALFAWLWWRRRMA